VKPVFDLERSAKLPSNPNHFSVTDDVSDDYGSLFEFIGEQGDGKLSKFCSYC
jgi:hypothetical protein